ncbi:hypothetical protein [Paenibacillus xanthanilyticus]|uniref:Uncharacterized protein n=1 Tax=Paenibacillus xanthanilyticus TaxID=1783531 RepID=A0ABV8KE61_9BACL
MGISEFCIVLHRLLVLIRADIKNPQSVRILRRIIQSLDDMLHSPPDKVELILTQLQKDIIVMESLNLSVKSVFDNVTMLHTPINQMEVYNYLKVIRDGTSDIILKLEEGDFELAYGMVDAIHALPEMVLHSESWNAKDFWKSYVHPIRKGENKKFLTEWERKLVPRWSLFN